LNKVPFKAETETEKENKEMTFLAYHWNAPFSPEERMLFPFFFAILTIMFVGAMRGQKKK
jgi:hypothetical protein